MKRRTAPTFESMASTSLMQKKCFAACLSWTPTHGRTTANVGGRDLALSEGGLRTWSLHTEILRPSGSSHSGGRQVVNERNSKKPSRTDWKRIDAMRDEDIDFSDAPELGPDFFKNAIIWPGPKKQITLRIDPDVLTFFRKHGRGYQSTMNAVLRKYMEARKEQTSAVRPRTSA